MLTFRAKVNGAPLAQVAKIFGRDLVGGDVLRHHPERQLGKAQLPPLGKNDTHTNTHACANSIMVAHHGEKKKKKKRIARRQRLRATDQGGE